MRLICFGEIALCQEVREKNTRLLRAKKWRKVDKSSGTQKHEETDPGVLTYS